MSSVCVGADITGEGTGARCGPGALGDVSDCLENPLDLYGSFRMELTPPGFDSSAERAHVRELIRLHGAGWVWSNRQRLVSLRKFVSRVQSGRVVR
jgi:hypothetical protein